MECWPGGASSSQGVLQAVSERPSRVAVAPAGLLITVTGWGPGGVRDEAEAGAGWAGWVAAGAGLAAAAVSPGSLAGLGTGSVLAAVDGDGGGAARGRRPGHGAGYEGVGEPTWTTYLDMRASGPW